MVYTAFWSIVPFEDGACADRTVANPATRPKDATRRFRFMDLLQAIWERLAQREAPNTRINLRQQT
jgi:hypothetical protein